MNRVYNENFPDIEALYLMRVEDLIRFTGLGGLMRVDILHLSLPCRFWSPAHTHETNVEMDELNRATLFTVLALLNIVRPRIVMLEQTFGLLTMEQKHAGYFQALIQQIEQAGYDVSWKIVDFRDFGLAQNRRRLVIYASNHE